MTHVTHLFGHGLFKFVIEQTFVHPALSHLSLENKIMHENVLKCQIISTLHLRTSTHMTLNPHKTTVWFNPVHLTHRT